MEEVKNKFNNIKYLLPIAFILAIVPLIVFAKKISISGILKSYWSKQLDFFSYYKMIVFLIAVLAATISVLIYFFKRKRLKRTFHYLLMEIYGILIIISTIYSTFTSVALWGFPDRYEGMFVLLGYLVVLFVTINLVEYKSDIKFLLSSLLISAVVISVIGILQYFGVDVLTTAFGKKFILPSSLYTIADNINAKFDYAFSTLYNPNYMGSYTGMLLSLILVLYTLTSENRRKIILGCFGLVVFAGWLACLSRAGMIGGFCSIIFLIVILRRELKNNWKSLVILAIGFIFIFVGMNYVGDGRLVREVFSFGQEIQIATGRKTGEFKDIIINKDQLTIITEEEKLQINFTKDNSFIFTDETGKKIDYEVGKDSGIIKLKNDKYQDYKFKLVSKKGLLHFEYGSSEVGKKKVNFKITTEPERGFWIMGFADKAYKTGSIEKWGFEGRENLGSNRGYIWSRSLPMLKDTIITGYGPDTYALYFPQYDNIGKLIAFNRTRVIVDKPHNMYLQIAINTGVISLLVVLLMFGKYILSSLKLYWNNEFNDFYSQVGIGVFMAVIAYLIAGLFNDSVISVAPVFWVLFGIGISINMKLKKLQEETS
ncbi:O-antigen ligase family protein [Sporohalobacter salinus]|uniref:O-antigen ligase family protein n=1 Tax=Sporohalobacter salinus TaxID=1494606 RepID=UPI00196144E8|nr:O-antigen ligase family protein [Sporohalobacter salinus]MBM7622732.1 hypothetical protein [Sporohalobacter salinus]